MIITKSRPQNNSKIFLKISSFCNIIKTVILLVLTFLFSLFFYTCAYAASGTVVYENVTMDTRLRVDSEQTLVMVLKGDNHINGGIEVPYGSTLIIEGDGSLTTGSPQWFGSGIGADDCGRIIINSGVLNVRGPQYGFAIGGNKIQGLEIHGGVINSTHMIGAAQDGNIAVYGGQINMNLGNLYTITSGNCGITCGDNGVMNIYGGIITVKGIIREIGVGGGKNSEINIWGGEIRIDRENSWVVIEEVGIGGYENSTVTINGGIISVRPALVDIGGGAGASIGGNNVDVTINGGNITAYANTHGAAIGCGKGEEAGTIAINGGVVTLYSEKEAACIGGGKEAKGGNVVISGGEITALSKSSAPEAVGTGTGGTSHGTLTLEPNGVTLYVDAGTDANDAKPLNGSPFTATASVIDEVKGHRYIRISTEGRRNEITNLDGEMIVHNIIVSEEATSSTNPCAIKGATVLVDGKTYITDSNGQVFITESGFKTVTVSAPNYRSQTLCYNLLPGEVQMFMLQKEKMDGKPYLTRAEGSAIGSSMNVGDLLSIDLRYQAMHFAQNDDRTINVYFQAEWNGHGQGTIKLFQGESLENAKQVHTIPDGDSYGFYPGTVFSPGNEVYAQLIAADGTSSDVVPLRLYIDSAWVVDDTESDTSLTDGNGTVDWFFNEPVESDNEIFSKFLTWDFSVKSDFIPVHIETEHNEDGTLTVSAQFGIYSAEEADNIKNMKIKSHPLEDTTWEEFKEFYNDVIWEDSEGDKSKLLKKFQKNYHPTRLQSSFDFNVDVGGYLDATYNIQNGKIINKEGGLSTDIKGAAQIGQTFLAFGFPVYWEAKLGCGFKYKANIELNEDILGTISFIPNKATFSLPKITVGAGIGVRGVATAGLEGTGQHKITIDGSGAKAALVGNFGVRAKVLFLIDEYISFADIEIPLWLWPAEDDDGNFGEGGGEGGGGGAGGGRSLLIALPLNNTANNEPQFTITSRSYLSELSSWYPYVSADKSRALPGSGLTVLQEGVMTDILPKLHIVNDQLILLYLQDVPSRTVGNHTQLVYSVYENGMWSKPQPVWETETADFFFDSYVDNGQLYVVWQKSSVIADGKDPLRLLEQVASNSEIALAVWDDKSKSFGQQRYITSNNVVDMMPVVGVNNDEVFVAWISNDQNNVFGTAGTNTLHKMNLTASDNSNIIGATDQFVAELSMSDDGLHVLYSVQNTDGTVDIIHNSNEGTSPVMTNVAAAGLAYENGVFYWQVDGAIYCYNPTSKSLEEIIPPETAVVSSSYQYTSNGSKTVIVWLDEEDDETAIKASVLVGNQWSQEVVLLDGITEHVTFFDAVMLNDGKYAVVINTGDIMENGEEKTTLQAAIVETCQDVEMVNAVSLMPDWETNQQEVTMTIRNNGFETVNNVALTIADDLTTYISTSKDLNLAPGATTEVTVVVDLSKFTTVVSPTVTVSMSNDANDSNNEKVITLGHVSVGLIADYYEDNENVYFLLEAGNTAKTKASTKLIIMEDSEDGAVIATINTGVLSQGDTVQYLYAIDKSAIDFDEDGYKTYFFRIDSMESDWNTSNNLCFYTVTQNNFARASLLSGTVLIDDYTLCGSTNTAIVADSNNTGILSYAWLRDGKIISTEQSYTPTNADVGEFLICKVTSSVELGSISRATYVIPAALFEADGYDSGVLSNTLSGMKYSIDGGAIWHDITENTMSLTGVTEVNDIMLYQPAIGAITSNSEAQIIDVTRAVPPALVASQPTTVNGTGSIPTDMSHEYSVDGINWHGCIGNLTELVPGDYLVRVRAVGAMLASEAQVINILAFNASQEVTPSASFNATGIDNGSLNNVMPGIRYSLDGGKTWNEVAKDGMIVSGVSEQHDIMLIKPGNGSTTIDSEIQIIDVTRAATPTLVASQPTTVNGTGSIPTDISHEYSIDGISWISCTGNLTELLPGTYYIRIKAAGSMLASGTQTITINTVTAAQVPIIEQHPEDANYFLDEKPMPLVVVATVHDGGTLAYQWYSGTSANGGHSVAIPGANDNSCLPVTNELGTIYYYCVITNTNNGSVAHAISNIVKVAVSAATLPPKTGDNFPLVGWIVIGTLAVSSIIFFSCKKYTVPID